MRRRTMGVQLLRGFKALLVSNIAEFSQYRVEYVIYMIAGTLPLVMMFVWMSLAETGAVENYSAGYFAAYFLIVYAVRQMNPLWLIRALDQDIRMGELSSRLLLPIHPYWASVAYHLTDMAIRLPMFLPAVLLGMYATDSFSQLSPGQAPAFLLALLGGMLIHFHAEYCLGLSAFWTSQSLALEPLYLTLYTLFGGAMLPIALYPEPVQQILSWTPFPYILDFPVQILLGRVAGPTLMQGFAVQMLWVGGLALAGRTLWHRGLRRYSAVGA